MPERDRPRDRAPQAGLDGHRDRHADRGAGALPRLVGRGDVSARWRLPPEAPARSPAYRRLEELLAAERCVVLDGGVATELQRTSGRRTGPTEELWGTWGALPRARRPCSTCTAATSRRAATSSRRTPGRSSRRPRPSCGRGAAQDDPRHWMDIARLGVQLARQAIEDERRHEKAARSRSRSPRRSTRPARRRRSSCWRACSEEDPPDLILLETLHPDPRAARRSRRSSCCSRPGLPVWLSFRRCRHGVCGVYGQHWGPPEGDLFGRAARRFEEMGVGALLINCLPVDHVPGIISWLRDFTEPAARRLSEPRPSGRPAAGASTTRSAPRSTPSSRSSGARRARRSSAAAAARRRSTSPRAARRSRARSRGAADAAARRAPTRGRDGAAAPSREPWLDDRRHARSSRCRFPELTVEPGVFVPTQGSYLVWKHLFRDGRRRRACAASTSAAAAASSPSQLALNGAERVHAIDIDRNAVANTLSNAFRNGVADRVTGEDVDLYQWEPDERFDVDRREPVPDARRPLRGADRAPPARLLGPHPARPLPRAAARAARGRRQGVRDAALDRRPAGDVASCSRERGLRGAGRRLQLLPLRAALRARTRSRSSASSSSPTPTT